MARYYNEKTVPAAWDSGDDVGFVPKGYKLALHSAGPVSYSFDGGTTTHGILGPAATRPMEVQINGGGRSRIWFDSAAGGETVSVWAWD